MLPCRPTTISPISPTPFPTPSAKMICTEMVTVVIEVSSLGFGADTPVRLRSQGTPHL